MKCSTCVFPFSFTFCIFSIYFSSNTIAFALLLINDVSNSSSCKSLSNGTDIIFPNKFARCATTHSYLFLPNIATLSFFSPILYRDVPNPFISSNNCLYVVFLYVVFSPFFIFVVNAIV